MATLDDVLNEIGRHENGGVRPAGPMTAHAMAQSDRLDAWNEGDHPRGEDGKFGAGSGSRNPDDELVTVIPSREERGHAIPAPTKGAISPEKERAWHEAKKSGPHFVGDSAKKLDAVVADCDRYDRRDAEGRSDVHIGWDAMVRKLQGEGHSKESAEKIAGYINKKKFG